MKTLILTGMPGSGKSECGRAIADSIKDSRFIETDKLIEESCQLTVSSIFAIHGEAYFRSLERLTVEILHAHKNAAADLSAEKEEDPVKSRLFEKLKEFLKGPGSMIISTGGGLPVAEGNMAMLKALGTVVYLAADAATLAERLQEDGTRPLLAGKQDAIDNKRDFNKANKEKFERISQLLRERDPVYGMADITIDTSFQTPEAVVNRLIAEFNRLQPSEDFDKTV